MIKISGLAPEYLWGKTVYADDDDLALTDLWNTGLPFLVTGPYGGELTVWFSCGCKICTWEGEYDPYLSSWCFDHDPEGGLEDELHELWLRDESKEAKAQGTSLLELMVQKQLKKGD